MTVHIALLGDARTLLQSGNVAFRAEAKSVPARLQALFLKKAPDAGSDAALQAAIRGPELVRAADRQAYMLYPDGMGRSMLTPGMIDGKLGGRGTSATGTRS